VTITSFPSDAGSTREVAHRNWAAAVRAYRSSLDLYRHVLTIRAQREARSLSPQTGFNLGEQYAPVRLRTQAPALQNLTPREREVAHLMACGYTNQQIAETLVLTRGTVANHVAHILDKLGASNRTQVAALVFLAPPDQPQPDGPPASNAAAD
jgi:DNA-binding NarL/FixJ family response regulator